MTNPKSAGRKRSLPSENFDFSLRNKMIENQIRSKDRVRVLGNLDANLENHRAHKESSRVKSAK